MNLFKGFLISSFILGVGILSDLIPINMSNEMVIDNPENSSAVVVELFTSQGCSSCPAADKVLSKIIDQSEESDLPVYGLSFHVDYWNRLGWVDPYSKREFTQRQYDYAKKIKSSSVYTPQMIVNGEIEFVGSKERIAKSNIASAGSKVADIFIKAKKISSSRKSISVEYDATGNTKNLQLNVAFVERGLFDNVTRGENRGRKLEHDNVVRAFTTQVLTDSGTAVIDLPNDVNKDNSAIILYIQDPKSFRILGATKVDLK